MKFLKIFFATMVSMECFASSVTTLIPITPSTARENGFDVYVYNVNSTAKCVNVKFPVRYKGMLIKYVKLQTADSLDKPDYFNIDLINYDYGSVPKSEYSEVRWCSSDEKFIKYEMSFGYESYKFEIRYFDSFQAGSA